MKLTSDQFTEAAFIFENANGAIHSEFEQQVIKESSLKDIELVELEKVIAEGLNSGIYET